MCCLAKIGIVNTTINNLNLTLQSRVNLINSVIKNGNINLTTKIGIVNTTLTNVNFNITTKINFVDSLINSTQIEMYPINLTGVPTGKGTYQQLITITNPSKYGINSNGSNIQFIDPSNSTTLYAWIQSINTTTLQVWVKNYNGSGKIDLEVLAKSEDLFSSTGYLGEAPQLSSTYGEYFNGLKVFKK